MASSEVVVDMNSESRLPSRMVLNDAVVVDVYVEPVRAPDGREWTVTLRGLNSSETVSETIHGGGSLRLGAIGEGRYLATVESDQQSFLAREVDVVAPATRLDLQLSLKPLKGRLRLGDSPLSGTLVFGGRSGAQRIVFHADREGAFEGYLPKGGVWLVDVEAAQPAVRRSMRSVEVARTEEGYSTEIRLPDTHLVGTVVDDRLRPVAGAIVHLRPLVGDDAKFSILADADGRFQASGLPATGVLASATASGDLGSDPVVLIPDEGHPHRRAQLVMSRRTKFRGQVTWEDTRSPVVGAFAKIAGLGSVQAMSGVATMTDSGRQVREVDGPRRAGGQCDLRTARASGDLRSGTAHKCRDSLGATAGGRVAEPVQRPWDGSADESYSPFPGEALEFVDYLVDASGLAGEANDTSGDADVEPDQQRQPVKLTTGLPPGQYMACAIPVETLIRRGLSLTEPRPDPDRCVVGLLTAGAETHLQLPDVDDPAP